MKKLVSIIIIVCATIGCVACTSTESASGGGNYLLDEKFQTETYLSSYDMQNAYARFKIACESENAYYFKPEQSHFIYFYDKETGVVDKLCGRPECSHDTADCNAYLDEQLGICCYNQKIYFTKQDKMRSVLYAMNEDGTDLERVQELQSDMNGWNPMMRIHREYVYTAVIKNEVIDGQESSRVIVQQEILGQESGETVVVYEEALWEEEVVPSAR